MGQSPSWQANSFSTSQEISRILLNPAVRYHSYQGLPTVLKMSQINPVHAASHYLKIQPSHLRLGLSSGLFPSGFTTKTLYALLLSSYVLHTQPISFSWFVQPSNICWGVQTVKFQFKPKLFQIYPIIYKALQLKIGTMSRSNNCWGYTTGNFQI